MFRMGGSADFLVIATERRTVHRRSIDASRDTIERSRALLASAKVYPFSTVSSDWNGQMPNDEAAGLRKKAVHARFLATVCLNDEMREELNAAARSFDV